MNKSSKRRTFLRSRGFFSLLFFLFFLPISLTASNCQVTFENANVSSITSEEIEAEITSYLISRSHSPVFKKADLAYDIFDIIEEDGVLYTLGYLHQDDTCLLALFSIEQGWLWTTTNLLYMTTGSVPAPELFSDIRSLAQSALPHSLSNYHILIQPLEHDTPPPEGYLETWSFYNLVEWIELVVLCVPTLDGGTDFVIFAPKGGTD